MSVYYSNLEQHWFKSERVWLKTSLWQCGVVALTSSRDMHLSTHISNTHKPLQTFTVSVHTSSLCVAHTQSPPPHHPPPQGHRQPLHHVLEMAPALTHSSWLNWCLSHDAEHSVIPAPLAYPEPRRPKKKITCKHGLWRIVHTPVYQETFFFLIVRAETKSRTHIYQTSKTYIHARLSTKRNSLRRVWNNIDKWMESGEKRTRKGVV